MNEGDKRVKCAVCGKLSNVESSSAYDDNIRYCFDCGHRSGFDKDMNLLEARCDYMVELAIRAAEYQEDVTADLLLFNPHAVGAFNDLKSILESGSAISPLFSEKVERCREILWVLRGPPGHISSE